MLSIILGMITAMNLLCIPHLCRFLSFCWCAIVTLLLEIDIHGTFVVPNYKHTCGSGFNAFISKVMKEDGM